MNRIVFSLCTGAIGCALALQFPLATNAGDKILHSFGGGTDGVAPLAGLIDVNGTLYGTTGWGGTHCQGTAPCGTVFVVDATTGAESVLYSFCRKTNCKDGQYPQASLIDVNGTLYGTTASGGTVNCNPGGGYTGCGTVFALDPNTGAETVVHSFGSTSTDGVVPYGGLIYVNGTLYGTTAGGGANCKSTGGCGTAFALDPATGAETELYSFCARKKCLDGSEPYAGLTYVKGTLYGITSGGGANYTECNGYGCGTVFALDPTTRAETVLYSFCTKRNCSDGAGPEASLGLIDVNGTLYGTTTGGGSRVEKQFCSGGCGTVFSLDLGTGHETVLYAFCNDPRHHECRDGDFPVAGLVNLKGTLYGTTPLGGAYGVGVLFALDPATGAETDVHTFGKGTDAANPEANLIDVSGTLYGASADGGANGKGTVFKLRP